MLDYVLERKSVEDLYNSIKDQGRYDKQKWRMHQCGLRHLIYLVEGEADTLGETGIIFPSESLYSSFQHLITLKF